MTAAVTSVHAPIGRMLVDGDRVCCHLCGRWFLSVASHLPYHGWTKDAYVEAFGLERSNPLSGEATRKRRAAALTARQAVEPAIVRAQAEARARARDGSLTAAATAAARGRRQPAERRAKTLATLAGIGAAARAEGSRRHAQDQLERRAHEVAVRFGFADAGAYLSERLARGMSMAAISREAGLHKDWVSRHLRAVAPRAIDVRPPRPDVRLLPVAHRLGYADVGAYLRAAHVEQHRSVAAIAAEAGVSREAIGAAMRQHGIEAVPHATKRHRAAERASAVAASLGFASLAAYVADRRARGVTWRDLAAESGLPQTTLRRQGRR